MGIGRHGPDYIVHVGWDFTAGTPLAFYLERFFLRWDLSDQEQVVDPAGIRHFRPRWFWQDFEELRYGKPAQPDTINRIDIRDIGDQGFHISHTPVYLSDRDLIHFHIAVVFHQSSHPLSPLRQLSGKFL